MNVYLAWTLTVFYYLIPYPILKALQWIIVLTPVWHGIRFALLPVEYLVAFTVNALFLPFNLLSKFETMYIYLGVASVVGIIVGALLHLSYSFLSSILHLESSPQQPKGRTLASYRAQRRKKKESRALAFSPSPTRVGRDPGPWPGGGLLGQTIVEEESSES